MVACRPLAEWVRTAEENTGVFITGDENASSARVARSTSSQEAVRAQELLRRAQAAAQQYRGEPAPKRMRLVVAGLGDAIGGRSTAEYDIAQVLQLQPCFRIHDKGDRLRAQAGPFHLLQALSTEDVTDAAIEKSQRHQARRRLLKV